MLASAWYIARQATPLHPEVCLCGERVGERCVVRQWVEYYVSRIRKETQWDALSRDELQAVLEVGGVWGGDLLIFHVCVWCVCVCVCACGCDQAREYYV